MLLFLFVVDFFFVLLIQGEARERKKNHTYVNIKKYLKY